MHVVNSHDSTDSSTDFRHQYEKQVYFINILIMKIVQLGGGELFGSPIPTRTKKVILASLLQIQCSLAYDTFILKKHNSTGL